MLQPELSEATCTNSALPLRLRIARKTVEAEGICSFELVAEAGGDLPPFEAGAHIDVQTPGGPVRQYSLTNPLARGRCYTIGVLDDPSSRGGSSAMHRRTAVGDVLAASVPRNHFALEPMVAHSLLLAGGIGITPLLAMAEQLHDTGASFALHYAARSASRMAFRASLQCAPYASMVALHTDDGPEAQLLDLARLLTTPRPGQHLYACGPAGFLTAVRTQADACGWMVNQVHFEHFSNPTDNTAQSTGDRAFEVQLARSGRVISVAADQTVVEALAACGVALAVSCEQGVCGTCLTRVLDGVPEHRDVYLTDAEHAANNQFTPCCSRARSSRLVLEL